MKFNSGYLNLGYLLFFIPLFSGCAVTSKNVVPLHSTIDAQFRYQQIKNSKNSRFGTSSGVTFYQRVLTRTLGSRCTLFPSDSQYTQSLANRCGHVVSTFRAMARFYFEPDAGFSGAPVLNLNGKIYFEDQPDDCSFF
ncbi:MAG TPA: hypothetical protein DCS07_14075 [Bdellovibrionales bacterium]|nr:MAG: hypothetical protein A2070_13900 [Bdellovibrionales bacterium GWC1_52_8]HAR43738.1 hypothetical protein [Bdellovibrionales bacterium]